MITLAMMHKSKQAKIGQRYIDERGNVYSITNILGEGRYLAKNLVGRGPTRTFTFGPDGPRTLYLVGEQTISLPIQ